MICLAVVMLLQGQCYTQYLNCISTLSTSLNSCNKIWEQTSVQEIACSRDMHWGIVFFVLFQVFGRNLVLFLVLIPNEELHKQAVVFGLFFVWSIIEVIRSVCGHPVKTLCKLFCFFNFLY